MNLVCRRCGQAAASIAAAALLVGSAPVDAQKSAGSASARSAVDKTFMFKAAQGGMAEVELGQLAAKKGSNPSVKQFGERMVSDHSKANEELKGLAQSKGMSLPASVGAKHKATMAKLQRLSGAAFDRTYMSEMVKDHKEDVAEFRKESTRGKDPDAKSFASKTLPTLQEHLKMAVDTQKQLTARSGRSGNAGKMGGGSMTHNKK